MSPILVTIIALLISSVFGLLSQHSHPKPIKNAEAMHVASIRTISAPESEVAQHSEAKTFYTNKPSGSLNSELKGVRFTIDVQEGWSSEISEEQITLRKPGDSRICQLSSDSQFDTKGFLSDVEAAGKEDDYEANLTKQDLEIGAEVRLKIAVSADILSASKSTNTYNYVVKLSAVLTLPRSGASRKMLGFNAVSVKDSKMVRLTCVNQKEDTDHFNEMEKIVLSLTVK
jgi:hypothetical protein